MLRAAAQSPTGYTISYLKTRGTGCLPSEFNIFTSSQSQSFPNCFHHLFHDSGHLALLRAFKILALTKLDEVWVKACCAWCLVLGLYQGLEPRPGVGPGVMVQEPSQVEVTSWRVWQIPGVTAALAPSQGCSASSLDFRLEVELQGFKAES